MATWNRTHDEETARVTAHALAIYPPATLDRRLRRDLDERGLPSPHRFHLTLKYSFIPTRDLRDHWEKLARIVSARPPLRLSSSSVLASAGTFCHLLLVAQEPSLMDLHDEVMSLLDQCGTLVSPDTSQFEGGGYNPHITLCYGASTADFELHHSLLAEYDPSVTFEARVLDRVDTIIAPDGRSIARNSADSFQFGETPVGTTPAG